MKNKSKYLLILVFVIIIAASIILFYFNSGNTQTTFREIAAENIENSYTDTYYCNNKILSPVTVQFEAQININKNNNGYYISDASYSKPLVINVKRYSFQINETNEELTNSGKTYIVSATGNYVKDNIDMGEVTLSAYFDIDTNTGKITSSSNM